MARWDDDGLEQHLDRWVETGRQLVDGVAGARPGSRAAGRGQGRRLTQRLNPADLGRWVEGKLDWLLDDEGDDDWREPWQSQPTGRRRPLDAISRRGRSAGRAVARAVDSPALPQTPVTGDWPDDEAFSINRWQRQPGRPADLQAQQESERDPAEPPRGGRPLPRSTRSRVRR